MASISYNYINGSVDQVVTLTVVETGYSIANNTSDIRWTLDVSAYGGSTWVWTGLSCVVNGQTVYSGEGTSGFPFPARPGSVSGTIKNIQHNNDGTKSISFSFSGWMEAYGNTFSKSGTLALTNIPRASSMTFPEFTAGQSGTFTINRIVNTYTHTIQYPIGTNIATGITTSYVWTPSINLSDLFPNATSGTIKVRLITYNGSTQIGYKDYDVTIKVPSSIVPDFSFTLSEGTASGFNRYVIGFSKLRATISNAVGAHGSTPTAAEMIINGVSYTSGINSGSAQLDSNTLDIFGTGIVVTVRVTDSRGRTKEKSTTINIYDYFAPKIEDIDIDVSGTTVVINVTGEFASVDGQNNRFITITKKNTATQVVTTVKPKTAVAQLEFTDSVTQTVSDIDTTSYEYTVTLQDKKNTIEETKASGIICISRYAGGKGLRLFGEAYQEGFMVGNIDMTITDAQATELDAWIGGTE
ncbi:MAG: DUF859 domain-containing protein [Lachnospiraceae bacterium]|nr:DUF859 domain-containing protein [Lachnospiraceae bacterium]